MSLVAAQSFIDIKNRVETERQTQSIRDFLRYGNNGLWNAQTSVRSESHSIRTYKGSVRPLYEQTLYHLRKLHETYDDQSKQSVRLGGSYANAHARLNHVKSFLCKKFFVFP